MWSDLTGNLGHRGLGLALLSAALIAGAPAVGQVSFTDINPNQSTLHPSDPDGASGGRVNRTSLGRPRPEYVLCGDGVGRDLQDHRPWPDLVFGSMAIYRSLRGMLRCCRSDLNE